MKPAFYTQLILVFVCSLSFRASATEDNFESDVKACKAMVIVPPPGGEKDLKGNPKLDDYCKCFAKSIAERASQGTPEISAEEKKQGPRNMRAACRKQFDLPELK